MHPNFERLKVCVHFTIAFVINDDESVDHGICNGIYCRVKGVQARVDYYVSASQVITQTHSQLTISRGQPDFWEGGPRVDIPTHVNRLSYKHNVLSFNYFTRVVIMYNN